MINVGADDSRIGTDDGTDDGKNDGAGERGSDGVGGSVIDVARATRDVAQTDGENDGEDGSGSGRVQRQLRCG